MGKLLITMPDEMIKALQTIAKTEDRVVAAIIRRLISEYLSEKYNLDIDSSMPRGGYRGSSDSDDDKE